MRLISAFIITLISAVIVFTSFELKAWTNNIRTEDVQSFVRYSDTQLNLTSWEEYLEREIELIPISEKIIKIVETDCANITSPKSSMPNDLTKKGIKISGTI